MKWLTDIGEPGAWTFILVTLMICSTVAVVSCHYKETTATRIKFEDTSCESKVFAIADKCMNVTAQQILCLQDLPAALEECND